MGKEGAKSAEIHESLTYERLLPTEKKQSTIRTTCREELSALALPGRSASLSLINMTWLLTGLIKGRKQCDSILY